MLISTDEFRVNNQLLLENYLRGEMEPGVMFTMRFYSQGSKYAKHCGTAGSAIGHAPYAGVSKLESDDWMQYARRTLYTGEDEFDWLFSGYWDRSNFFRAIDVAERLEVVRKMRTDGIGFREACASIGEHAIEQAKLQR